MAESNDVVVRVNESEKGEEKKGEEVQLDVVKPDSSKENEDASASGNAAVVPGDKRKKQTERPKLHFSTIGRILVLAKAERWLLFWGTFSLLITTGASLLMPAYAGQVFTAILPSQSGTKEELLRNLNSTIFWLFGILSISSFFGFIRSMLFTVAGERVVVRLRKKLFSNVVVQEIGFFDERRTGELMNRLAADCQTLQNTASVNISMFIRFSVSTIAGIAVLFVLSWSLTLVMLGVVPIVAIGASWYGRWVRELSKKAQDALAESGETAEDALSNIRTVRSFAGEDNEIEHYDGSLQKYYGMAKKRAIARGGFTGVVTWSASFAILAVLYYGAVQVVDGVLSPGILVSYIIYTFQVFAGVATITSLYSDLMRAMGASDRVFELLDREPKINIKDGLIPKQGESRIVLEDVQFSYPTRKKDTVLKDLSLTLDVGQVVALVGPSGAGKSTIAHLIERLYDPQAGTVYINEEDVRALDPQWWHRNIGLVHQEPVLFATTIAKNIAYGRPDATMEEIKECAKMANAFDFIESFPDQFETLVGERGVRLSGGQKQRVAIARAILCDPKVLILDEATSALDAESEHLVQEALERLMSGRTTLIIAHRLSTVKSADMVVVLDNGQLVESGKHDELMAKDDGSYRALIERQIQDVGGF